MHRLFLTTVVMTAIASVRPVLAQEALPSVLLRQSPVTAESLLLTSEPGAGASATAGFARGGETRSKEGAILGAVVGAIAGGLAANEFCNSGDAAEKSCGYPIVGGAVLGGIVPGTLFGLVGLAIKK